MIFITHIHSDHNLGILNLISERERLLKQRRESCKLFLVIPFNVFNWYASYNQTVEDLSANCQVLFTQVLLAEAYEETDSQDSSNTIGPSLGCNENNFEDRFFSELEVVSILSRTVP